MAIVRTVMAAPTPVAIKSPLMATLKVVAATVPPRITVVRVRTIAVDVTVVVFQTRCTTLSEVMPVARPLTP